MLVSELIEALQKLPQDMEVWTFYDPGQGQGEIIGEPEIGFVTDLNVKESMGTLWPDLSAYEDVDDEKKKVVVVP